MKIISKFVIISILISLDVNAATGIGWIPDGNMLIVEHPISKGYALSLSGTVSKSATPNVSSYEYYRYENNIDYLSGRANLDLLRYFNLYCSTKNQIVLRVSLFARATYSYRREIIEHNQIYFDPNLGINSSYQDTKRMNMVGIAFGIRPEIKIFDRMSMFMTAGIQESYIHEVLSESSQKYDHRFQTDFFNQGFGLTSISLMIWL